MDIRVVSPTNQHSTQLIKIEYTLIVKSLCRLNELPCLHQSPFQTNQTVTTVLPIVSVNVNQYCQWAAQYDVRVETTWLHCKMPSRHVRSQDGAKASAGIPCFACTQMCTCINFRANLYIPKQKHNKILITVGSKPCINNVNYKQLPHPMPQCNVWQLPSPTGMHCSQRRYEYKI